MNNPLSPYTGPTQQLNFRALMNAFAYPGRIQDLQGEGPALEQVLATLIDGEVSLADTCSLLSDDTCLRLEANLSVPEQANFIVCLGTHTPAFNPCVGTLEEPEHGATLIVQVQGFCRSEQQADSENRLHLVLSGPGIPSENRLWVQALNPAWLQQRAVWNSAFPMGVDFILVSDRQLVALPRTTTIQGGF